MQSQSTLRLADWPPSDRPRERLLTEGPDGLADAELLALVLGSGIRGCNGIVEMCRQLLAEVGQLEGLSRRSAADLMRLQGIGPARACALVATAELARRFGGSTIRRGEPILSSTVAYERLRRFLEGRSVEVFVVLALDARNRLMSVSQVAQGSVTGVDVHPREVFVPLVREWAVAGIVAHNHPSGDPEPSREDCLLTERLVSAARVIGLPLLDHLVIGAGCYVSLADRGLMQGI